MKQEEIREIFERYRVIAVVGLSRKLDRPSHHVSAYMKNQGYTIVPVNPYADEVLGEKSYKSLTDMPTEVQKTIEVVDIFRRSEDVPPVVNEAINLKEAHGHPFVVWMQLGIVNEEAAESARRAGLTVVMDRCMMVEHRRL